MRTILGVLLALLTFAAPGYGQERSPVLDKLIAGFVTAFNAKDMTALLSSCFA